MAKEKVHKFATAAEMEDDLLRTYAQMTGEERWAIVWRLAQQYWAGKPKTMSETEAKKVYKFTERPDD